MVRVLLLLGLIFRVGARRSEHELVESIRRQLMQNNYDYMEGSDSAQLTRSPTASDVPVAQTDRGEENDRDRDVQDLNRDREVPDRDREITDRDREIPDRDREIPDRDREIPDRDRQIPDQDNNVVRDRHRDVRGRNRDIRERHREVRDRDGDIRRQDRDVQEQDPDVNLHQDQKPHQPRNFRRVFPGQVSEDLPIPLTDSPAPKGIEPSVDVNRRDLAYYMDDTRLAALGENSVEPTLQPPQPTEPPGEPQRRGHDDPHYEKAHQDSTVRYRILEVPVGAGPSGRRSGGSRRFLQEERQDGVALVNLDDGPFPEFRLPQDRRQYMVDYMQSDLERADVDISAMTRRHQAPVPLEVVPPSSSHEHNLRDPFAENNEIDPF